MEPVRGESQALKFTSSHVFDFYSQGSKETAVSTPVFDCGAVFDPFSCNGSQNVAEVNRTPIVCIRCSAYLNYYSIVMYETGEWVCPLCKSSNPKFTSALPSTPSTSNPPSSYAFGRPDNVNNSQSRNTVLRDSYAELRSPHCDFYEEASTSFAAGSAKPNSSPAGCFVFGIDIELCADNDVIELLCGGIRSLPERAEVCVLLYGRHIYALRLGGGLLASGNPLVSDVLPGTNDRAQVYAHLVSRGTYGIPAGVLLGHLDVLRAGLTTLSNSDSRTAHTVLLSNQVDTTIDALVSLAVALGSAYAGSAQDAALTRLVLLTSRSLSCKGSTVTTNTTTPKHGNKAPDLGAGLSLYNAIGAYAYRSGCSVDIFSATLRAANRDQLAALVSPSGGAIVVGNAYNELHVRSSFAHLLQRCSAVQDVLHSTLPTLEIRTCSKLVVDRIVGPIVSAGDVVLHNNKDKLSTSTASAGNSDAKMTLTEAGLAIDSAHLAQSLYYLEHSGVASSTSGGGVLEMLSGGKDNSASALYNELVKRNQEHVVLSGINLRPTDASSGSGSNSAVSIQFRVNHESNAGVQSPYKKGNVVIGSVGDTHESHSRLEGHAFVQIVVRFVVRKALPGSATPVAQKVTRVFTTRLPVTSDREEYLRGLDAPLWALVASRGLVADHHTHCMRAFGGAMRNRLDQEGRYAFAALRAGAVRTVDELAAAVAQEWPHATSFSQEKVLRAVRALYQLREGPLLDGPAADHMEAYLLRCTFLKAEQSMAMRLLVPSLTINTTASNNSGGNAAGAIDTPAAQEPLPSPSHPAALYPPPSSAPPSATPQYAPPAGPPPSAQVLYPPPSLPPPSTGVTTGLSLSAPVSALYPPPPTPPPSTGAAFPFPPPPTPPPGSTTSNSAKVITPPQQNNDVSLSVAPDSTGLLPGTIAVLDCGDRIIVRKNILRTGSSETAATLGGGTAAAGKLALQVGDLLDGSSHALLSRLEKEALAVAGARYPVPSVFMLPRAGTPQDRMLYCRLAPTHTDTREAVHGVLLNSTEMPHLLGLGEIEACTSRGGAAQDAERRAQWSAIASGLTAQDVDALIAPLPYTDQPFFAKYLTLIAPVQAVKLLSKLTLPVEEARRAAPVSMSMDRGPPVVFAPPTQAPPSYGAHRAPPTSSDSLPL